MFGVLLCKSAGYISKFFNEEQCLGHSISSLSLCTPHSELNFRYLQLKTSNIFKLENVKLKLVRTFFCSFCEIILRLEYMDNTLKTSISGVSRHFPSPIWTLGVRSFFPSRPAKSRIS